MEDTAKKIKRLKIFVNDGSDEELISRLSKELSNVSNNKNNPVFKWAKNLKWTLIKEDRQWQTSR